MTDNLSKFHPDLIYDVGAHVGEDTYYYLNKGFRVVAIEANPTHVAALRSRFSREIDENRLHIVGKGIHEAHGSLEFYVHSHDDWSSFNKNNRFVEGEYKKVLVPTVPFSEILSEFGVPYYIKADIEGSEIHVFSCFPQLMVLPTYVSFELHGDDRCLNILRQCGYNQFKLADQRRNNHVSLPNPPLEGLYFPYQFSGISSGAFGEEAIGSWKDYDAYVDEYEKCKENWSNYQGWYDLHLKRNVLG